MEADGDVDGTAVEAAVDIDQGSTRAEPESHHVAEDEVGGADREVEPRSLGARLVAPPAVVAGVFALVFAWRSFIPTLMPRTWITQAAITALSAALGYAIGALIGALGRRILLTTGREIPPHVVRAARWSLVGGAGLVVLVAVIGWARWQNQQRDLLGMDHLSGVAVIPMLVLMVVLLAVLVVIGRLIGRGVAAIHRFNRRRMPALAATPVTVALVVALVVVVGQDGLIRWATDRLEDAYGLVDTTTRDGTVQPDSPLASGSPPSLAPWDTLGMEGRNFASRSTPVELMRELHGDDAEVMEPVRVYAGLESADTPEGRAELVVEELRRTGGFEREYLAVWTVTGTGWVDPDAARAFELLHRGDTAIAAMQYSYLPSWIAMVLDPAPPLDAGAVLFETIAAAWQELPEDDRPTLVVFGQSLGSFGAEAPFAAHDVRTSVNNLVTRTEGVLFTGPTNDNTIWRQLLDSRDPYSPAWRPIVPEYTRAGSVRFANGTTDLVESDPSSWRGTRVLYVAHPSDPVTFWGMDWLWSPPEWMDHPRGSDVPRRGGWFPVVTWVQGVFDLMAGFGAPPGHGHDYREVFAAAWAQVTPVDGWSGDDVERMADLLAATRPEW